MNTFKLCGFDVGLQHRFFLIAGTCVIESEQSAIDVAGVGDPRADAALLEHSQLRQRRGHRAVHRRADEHRRTD